MTYSKRFFTLAAITFTAACLTIYGTLSSATETDQYTYSYVPLRDSAPALNEMLNFIFQRITYHVNLQIAEDWVNKNHEPTGTDVEYLFSKNYRNLAFEKGMRNKVFSDFEICVDTNQCKSWPKFDRIYLEPSESIYYSARYSPITMRFIASTLMACGVRFGSDKLTHMLSDGFLYYDYSRDNRHPYTLAGLKRLSLIEEWNGMGATFTGVVSHADVAANIAGIKLFRDIFANHLFWRKNKLGLVFKPINICDYITPQFDERIEKNEYVHKDKIPALESAIAARSTDSKFTQVPASEILKRKPKLENLRFADEARAFVTLGLHYVVSKSDREADRVFMYKPSRQHRRFVLINYLP